MKSSLKGIGMLILTALLAVFLAACDNGRGDNNTPIDNAGSAPVADAGDDQNVKTGSLVTFDGSGSSDADGDILTYNWSFTSKPDGSNATFSDSTVVKPAFTADVDGTYVINLVVNDDTVDSLPDTVTITAATANSAPVADAGDDQNVKTGSLVTLDGSGSSNADGDILTYNWSFTSKPDGSNATFSDSTIVNPAFAADVDGTYVINLVVNDGTVDSLPDTVTITAATFLSEYQTYGLNFSPYIDGQDPNLGSEVSEEQLRTRMEVIKPYTVWIRTFGSSNGLEKSGFIAHNLDLKAALGAWISSDLATNEQEIENLIAAAKAGEADLLIVGSEVMLRGDLSEDELINYIKRVKQEVPELPVSYADVYGVLLSHPNILDAVDIVLVNYYPYWEGISIDLAVAAIHGWHTQVTAAANGKQVIVSETGWPSDGNQVGNAIPSSDNASLYFLNFVSWSRANDVDYFYFEAFDESWKATYEGPQGAHWGIWDKDGTLKPGMERVFNGETMEDNWSGGAIPGGPGDPAIEFTHVPPFGSFEDLEGQVWHVDPADYKVAVYIYVSGWWTKPTFANPLTTIQIDGSWITNITTGGVDETANKIAAFLVPNGYNPPLMSGGGTLPSELDQNAIANVEVTRIP